MGVVREVGWGVKGAPVRDFPGFPPRARGGRSACGGAGDLAGIGIDTGGYGIGECLGIAGLGECDQENQARVEFVYGFALPHCLQHQAA